MDDRMRLGAIVGGCVLLVVVALATWRVMQQPPATTVVEVDAGSPPAHDAGPRPRASADPRPNILLITIDSLRADHVSAYGYDRQTAPTITSLAGRGALFRRAYTTSTWSVPAVASLLTGVSPAEHGALHGATAPRDVLQQEVLPEGLPSLATALHDAGYHTVGVSATAHYDAALGYGRGFDEYRVFVSADRADVLAAIGGQLDELRSTDGPYFLWVHLVDPHLPYTPREPQFGTWWPSTRERLPELDRVGIAIGLVAATRRAHVPAPVALEYLVAAYDSEIRAADDFVEDALTRLDDGHLAVVVTSTHGEELGDHHGMGHGRTLFDELVRVPLVIALPEQEPREVTAMASLLDVFPTLLEIADAPADARLPGLSLVPAMRGDASFPENRDVMFETGGLQVLRGIFDGHYKYGERVGPHPVRALFDLVEDPYEQTDVLAAHQGVADALRARMMEAMSAAEARRPAATATEIPQTVRVQLTQLGYGNQ